MDIANDDVYADTVPSEPVTDITTHTIHPPLLPRTLGLFDLKLLHIWTTETYRTLSPRPELQTIWRVEAPKVGFSSPYVMHAILSVASLHLSRLCSPERKQQCFNEAQLHHDAAMQTVVPNISRLIEEQGTAVILFSWLTCFYSCGRPRTQDESLLLGRDGPAEWLTFFRGNKVILESSSDTFRSGILAPVFANGERNAYLRQTAPVNEGEKYVGELRNLILEHVTDPEERQTYCDVLDLLSKSFVIIMDSNSRVVETTVVLSWLLEVSNEYIEFLRRKSPLALIIYAYFCVLVKKMEWMWWVEGLSHQFMGEIYGALDEVYRTRLQWPMSEIGWSPDS
ncbi:hypothetical protein BBP40_002289 [Aspergillus hancockii]|nr:hypothetical protein BBP40_002289 [Aspergillus hancockii]